MLSALNKYPHLAGVDEVGRGCLAGPVMAAVVVLPSYFSHPLIRDSKKLNSEQRQRAKAIILNHALAWSIAQEEVELIDEINILQATYRAMNKAIQGLRIQPDFLVIDGNRFLSQSTLPYQCIVKGDERVPAIAAASILAKVYRDEWMIALHEQFPHYGWNQNKGYGTKQHIQAIRQYGITPQHRKLFVRNFLTSPSC